MNLFYFNKRGDDVVKDTGIEFQQPVSFTTYLLLPIKYIFLDSVSKIPTV